MLFCPFSSPRHPWAFTSSACAPALGGRDGKKKSKGSLLPSAQAGKKLQVKWVQPFFRKRFPLGDRPRASCSTSPHSSADPFHVTGPRNPYFGHGPLCSQGPPKHLLGVELLGGLVACPSSEPHKADSAEREGGQMEGAPRQSQSSAPGAHHTPWTSALGQGSPGSGHRCLLQGRTPQARICSLHLGGQEG